MPVRTVVWKSFYQDSVALMRLAADLRTRPGVREAAALMGTPANRELLASAGLATPEANVATPSDLVLAVDAATDAEADAACAAARAWFEDQRRTRESEARARPRTLESALRTLPDATLAVISVPGAYAKLEALTALRRGLNVFLFSDNVTLPDEVELKRLAIERGLLCMGPDCGTAYLNGVALGFANVVPRGRVGLVAASGTGLQAVVSRLAGLGEGVSHGIGVGGRDLTADVGGAMTLFALAALARDPATAVIVIVAKPPAPAVLPALERAIAAVGKPVVVCALGSEARPGTSGRWVATLEDAADATVAALRERPWEPATFSDAAAIRARLAALAPPRGALLGLYTGGTLAQEARLLLTPLLGPVAANFGDPAESRHTILDLGADELTRGRPHPMIDPSPRDARVRAAAADPGIAVLLFDLVLGRAAHPDPASSLAAAVRDARARAGRSLVAVGSVVGTDADPQGLARQTALLRDAGVEVLPSNAQAARFAALALDPVLAARMLGA